ncbi:MAG: hypothetical protein R2762_11975 [Bryobacteraceae bacterium]
MSPAAAPSSPTSSTDLRETLIANTLSSTTWSFNLAIGSALGGPLLGVSVRT